jgi:hypothetical protein
MRLLAKTLTLQRTGTINVRVSGPRHCGAESAVTDGMVAVRYTAVIAAHSESLDSRGFLVDQERLHKFMVDIGMEPVPWANPCEVLAFIWGYRLLDWISTENIHCTVHTLDLTLSPAPNAGQFTAHFAATIKE